MYTGGIAKTTAIVIAIVIIIAIVAAVYYVTLPPAPTPTPTTPTTPTPVTTPSPSPPTPTVPGPKAWRLGTTEAGSIGYAVGSLVADTIRGSVPGIDISVYPVGGWPVNIKEFAAGNLELAYTDPTSMIAAMKREPPFEAIPPDAVTPVHTLHVYSCTFCIATTPELKEKYNLNSWRDLDGKKVALFQAKWMSHAWLMKALSHIGVKPIHTEMSLKLFGDALKREDVVAIGIHACAGIPSPHTMEILAKMDLVIINPLPEDRDKIVKVGFPFGTWSPEVFGKDMGVDEVFGLILPGGWHTHPKVIPEEAVYLMVKGMIAAKDDLKAKHKYFGEFAEDPIGFQVKMISLTPDLPVHPGLAKVLKEYGVWKDEWKVAQ